MEHGWMLDELAHAGAEHLDADYVQGYDTKSQVPAAEIVTDLVRLGLTPDATLIDFGAGTGEMAIAAARHCARVVGVEVSPAMVRAAERKAQEAGTANVSFVQAGFLSYQHEGAPADVACSRHALHQLPDFWKGIALARIAGVMRPGGVFWLRDLVYSFDPGQASQWLDPWLAAAPGSPDGGWTAAELATHIREEHSTYSWLLEELLDRTGFAITEREYSPSRVFASYVCTRR